MNDQDPNSANWPIPPGYILLGIIFAGAVVRLYLVFTAAGMNSDAFRYLRTAEKMADDGLIAGMRGDFVWPFYPVNRNLIVFPYLGRLLLPVTGNPILALRLVSALAGIGLIPLGYAIADRLFDKKGIALMTAVMLAFQSEFARASAAIYREVLMAFLVTCAFYLTLRIIQDDDRRSYVWAGVCGIVVFLGFATRVEMVAAAGACGAIILFLGYHLKWKKRIVTCCVIALLFLAFEIPWVLWMKKETGRWMANQWQVFKEMKAGECVKRHFGGEKQP